MMRRSGSPCARRGGPSGPAAPPWEPSQLTGLWLRMLGSDATTGSWVDAVGGRSFTGAGTPTINATDANFNNQPTVTFDGVDDSYSDAGTAADYDFMARTDTGTNWLIAMCFRLTSPATAATQRIVSCGDLGTAGSGLQIFKSGVASGYTQCGGYTVGNGNPIVAPIATFTASTVWLVYGFRPTTTGAAATGVSYRTSGGAYSGKVYSWTGPYTTACNVAMVLGKTPGGASQYCPMTIAEIIIAKTTLTTTIASNLRTYFNATYGATL